MGRDLEAQPFLDRSYVDKNPPPPPPREPDAEDEKKNTFFKSYAWHSCIMPLTMLCIVMGILLGLAMVCPKCLFIVFFFCACTCGFVPIMNIPLWVSMIILILKGWTISNGVFSLSWQGVPGF